MNARLVLAVVAAAQTINPSPAQISRLSRPLQSSEIAVVLGGVRSALAGRMFRLSYPGRDAGPEFLMRDDGRPARMRTSYGISGGGISGAPGNRTATEWHDDFVDIVDYTGQPARRCDGTALGGELVVTYQRRASTNQWTARAATTALDFQGLRSAIGEPIFNILAGVTSTSSDAVPQPTDGRMLRALTAPFLAPSGSYGASDPVPAATEFLWIAVDSLLPVKWQVAINDKVGYEMDFTYKSFDLRPPEGIEAPPCIP